MSQVPPPPPPPPPYGAYAPPPPPPPPPPRPQVVHIVAKPGGFSRAIGFVIGLLVIGAVFFVGMGLGIGSMLSNPTLKTVVLPQQYRTGARDTVAIIPVRGVISARSVDYVRTCVDKVLSTPSMRAVVLRVDSPGGGVTASDQIWYQVKRLQDAGKPVVASYGAVAASGGYYVSCHADLIMAEETCVTGSIGVIAQILTMEGLMDKVGIEPVTLVASDSPQKDVANDVFRQWNEADREKIMTVLNAAYDTFLERVQDGRSDSISDPGMIRALADGSIYTSEQALSNGLIDSIGYLDDAIAEAEKRASLPRGRSSVVVLVEPPSLFGTPSLVQGLASTPTVPSVAERFDADRIRSFANELGSPRLMYLMR